MKSDRIFPDISEMNRAFAGVTLSKIVPSPVDEPAGHKLNTDQTVAVSTDVYWNEDMNQAPRGVKLQLLGAGGVAVYCEYHGDPFWQAWAPLPKRRPRGCGAA